MQKAKNYEFYNIPKEYSLFDYNDTINYIIKRYSQIRGLVSIYSWGGPVTPGISDIDFVFVLDRKKAASMPFFKRFFYIIDEKYRYIARHPFFYIDTESFKKIRHVYPDADFKLLYGKSLDINYISARDAYFSRIALMNDIIIRHYPRDFLEQDIVKSINARDMLLRLNSLKYSIKTMDSLLKRKNRLWNNKLKNFEGLRKNWFRKNDFRLMALLNEYAIKLSIDITENFRDYLRSNDLVKINSDSNLDYNGARNNSLFISGWSKEKAISKMSKSVKAGQTFFSVLPVELAPQLIEYSKYKGAISRYIKRNLKGSLKYSINYSVKERAMIFNNQAELASTLKHSDFVAFFSFGYRSKSGINNLLLNFARKYRD